MDVSFTNVLEGARQYFQGLPAASTSQGGGGGAYNAEAPPASASYWPQEPAPRPQPVPPNQHYQYQEQFQFPRPQSREAPSNQHYPQYQEATPHYQQLQNVATTYAQKPTNQMYYHQYQPVQNKVNNTYKTSQENAYYKHLYTNSVPQQQQQQQQNVAPMASLMSYHSNRTNAMPQQQQQQRQQQPKPSLNNVQQRSYQYQNQYQYNATNTVAYSSAQSTSHYYQPAKPNVTVNGRVMKRESPLDLSVKTVRTPADSTLDDDKNYYRNPTYPNYDVYNRNRSVTAPKVEFQPNFINQMGAYRRVEKPVPPSQQMQRVAYNTNNRYPIQNYQKPTLPRVDFPHQKSITMYQEAKKRPAEPIAAPLPTKIPKVDPWRQKIDQTIEQRFSLYQQQQAKNAQVNGQYQYHQQYQQKTVGGADKRVLSLLRNSLEIKEQRKRLDVQQPSTDVTAPLQPKPTFVSRNNVSPFTPDPGNYKLHMPKAVDSVNFRPTEEVMSNQVQMNHLPQTSDLDGLAALVAARIRTKAELKQVSAPRKRLFSREGEEGGVPPRDKTRSSSETSVFDFTDSDGEMPALEDMRRKAAGGLPPKSVEAGRAETPDDAFAQACDSFVEQLKCGSGKKRGRRKKLEREVLEQLEKKAMEEVKKEIKEEVEDEKKNVPLQILPRPAKKPTFGDGSHFYPGWEEEVYKYKKSLRMPPSLIHVTRPPRAHRLSTSLPDLEPKIKAEALDSDNESNYSFNLFSKSNYDSEGSSSIKSLPNTTKESRSILDRLLERYSAQRKPKKEKETEPIPDPVNNENEDRPASAPPVTCLIKKEDLDDDVSLSTLIKNQDTRQVLKSKLLNRGRKESLLKTLVDKKIKSELLDDDDSKSETPSLDGDENSQSGRKKHKFRNIRRKFSSGFDYIRKKKKKKEETNEIGKQKKVSLKSNPGSVQDIQKEIKGWVLNKGIGETILHRAARLGYTDITAYCLEKMECFPSPKDNAGYTPLHEASTKGNLAIAKMLLMYGANVSESARGGIRPLHEAIENGFVEIVRLLLSYGADPMLATYSGMKPLALCSDELTTKLLQGHIDDIEGTPSAPWDFAGPASCFDAKETGFDVLLDAPSPGPSDFEDEVEFEMSDSVLPNLYTLRGESQSDRWILLQDLSNMLKIKSRDALLRQICPSSGFGHKTVLRELKMCEFLEQAHCCQFLNIGEKVNTRASKIALIKYTDKVRELLNVEKVTISVR